MNRWFYLDLRHSEAHPWPVGEPGEVVVHVLEDHVDAPLVLVTVDYFLQQHDNASDRRHNLTIRRSSNANPQAKPRALELQARMMKSSRTWLPLLVSVRACEFLRQFRE